MTRDAVLIYSDLFKACLVDACKSAISDERATEVIFDDLVRPSLKEICGDILFKERIDEDNGVFREIVNDMIQD